MQWTIILTKQTAKADRTLALEHPGLIVHRAGPAIETSVPAARSVTKSWKELAIDSFAVRIHLNDNDALALVLVPILSVFSH